MSDPYRDMPVASCPRCNVALQPTGDDTLACAQGCGQWRERSSLPAHVEIGALAELDSVAGVTGNCPRCSEDMDARIWKSLRFEACTPHGIWLDAGTWFQFDELIASVAARVDRVTAFAELLASQTPEGYRELARRIIALEDQLARLGRR